MKSYFLCLLCLLPLAVQAQQFQISGILVDAKTNEPLPFGNVYINNSTQGTNTNLEGRFSLTIKDLTEPEIVVSYIGYETFRKQLKATERPASEWVIKLNPLGKTLDEIQVKAKRPKDWEKQYEAFKDAFFGTSSLAAKCSIENSWVLDFQEKNGELTASASVPLQLQNRALGYAIQFDLKSFKKTHDSYQILGSSHFTELTPASKKEMDKWYAARAMAYKKSAPYLFKSWIDNKLTDKQIALYRPKASGAGMGSRTDVFSAEVGRSVEIFPVEGTVKTYGEFGGRQMYIGENLEVHNQGVDTERRIYRDTPYAVSWLTATRKYAIVDKNGILLNPHEIMLAGDMDSYRMAGLLPTDYDPTLSENEAYFKILEKTAFIERVVLHTDRPAYYAPDNVWFKAYLNYSSFSPKDTASSVLHVQLVQPGGQVAAAGRARILNGYASGLLKLPDNLSPGTYVLRAFTRHQLNFEKPTVYEQWLPVLSPTQLVKSTSQNLLKSTDYQAVVVPSDTGTLIRISDLNGAAVQANCSVSLTEPTFSQHLTPLFDTAGWAISDKAVFGNFTKKHEKEAGLKIDGVLLDDRKKPLKSEYQSFMGSMAVMEEGVTGSDGRLTQYPVDFFGESNFYIKTKDTKHPLAQFVPLAERPLQPAITTKQPAFELVSTGVPVFVPTTEKSKTERPAGNKELESRGNYGRPNHILAGDDIDRQNGMIGVLNSLRKKIPGLRITNDKMYLRGGGTSLTLASQALILVNGVPGDYTSLDPTTIDQIEVLSSLNGMLGDQGRNGVVAFYQRQGGSLLAVNTPPADGFKSFPLQGYLSSPNFTTPNWQMASPSHLTPTVYWAAEAITNQAGEVFIPVVLPPNHPLHLRVIGVTNGNNLLEVRQAVERK